MAPCCASYFSLILLMNAVTSMEGKTVSDSGRPRVVIIGGGIAGCATAWSLKRELGVQIDLTIVEADDRLGGRIFTTDLKGDSISTGDSTAGISDSKLEMGANWVHGTEGNPLYSFLSERDLATRADEMEGEWIGLTDRRVRIPDKLEARLERFVVELEDARTEFFKENRKPTVEDANDDALEFTSRYFERRLFVNAKSEEEKNLMRGFARYANLYESNSWGCDDLSHVSLDNYGSFRESPGDDVPLKNGFGSVIDYLSDSLGGDEVLLNAAVDEIVWSGEEDNGKETLVKLRDGRVLLADYVVISVSAGCLKARQPRFNPPLPKDKLDAIDGVGYGTVDKLFLQLNPSQVSALTNAMGKDTAGVYFLWSADVDVNNIEETWIRGLYTMQLVRRDLLLFWIHGVEARYVENLADEVVLEALDGVLALFLQTELTTFRRPKKLIRTRWHANQFTRGSYSFPAKGQPRNVFERMSEPIVTRSSNGTLAPKILFAGEATHPYFYSTTHGAFESGLREATRLHRYLTAVDAGVRNQSHSHVLSIMLAVVLFFAGMYIVL